jgi:hypothetical protein
MTLGALGKNIENEAGPINHAGLEQTLQIALLGWRQRMVEDYEVELKISDGIANFLGFARSDKKRRIWRRTPARHTSYRLSTRRF